MFLVKNFIMGRCVACTNAAPDKLCYEAECKLGTNINALFCQRHFAQQMKLRTNGTKPENGKEKA